MKKRELLSPVGNMESLLQAIHNGADAVYLGLKNFGARAFAKNFDEDEIIKAIKTCHLYGVKIYITMNTLVKDNEVDNFLNQVDFLHKNGVDAIIMQDFGMICLTRQMYPNLEIHASTQANNSSIDTISLFHKLGVKRVVVSRELSLEEINSINVPIELEVFIHGALCISYSGNCLMSSMIGKRSANKGECTGCCRLPYTLYENDRVLKENKYLLSTKELNSSNNISKLLESNITSFKIEGRMKSPEYVGFVTKFYRNLLDQKQINLKLELDKLRTIFNREFTEGNLFNTTSLMNTNTPNHIGLKIGKVVDITKKKIKIKLSKELNQEDGIRFLESGKGLICNFLYDAKDNLIHSSKNFVYVDNKIDLKTYDTVYKTLDRKLIKELNHYNLKKIPIDMKLVGKVKEQLRLIIQDNSNNIEVLSNKVEKARTSSISKERIKLQLEKLGNTPYQLKNIEIDTDENIFISIKDLNDLRRDAISKLSFLRENVPNNYLKQEVIFDKLDIHNHECITASVMNEEQLLTCLELSFDRIYVKDFNLYEKYKYNTHIYYQEIRNRFLRKNNISKKLVSEYFEFNKENIGNYFLNITNSYTAYYLLKHGIHNFTLSVELTEEELTQLVESFKTNFKEEIIPEILVYGKVENMYIKGNILNIDDSLYKYKLKDIKDRYFDVYLDNGNTTILNFEEKTTNSLNFKYQKRFDFYDESSTMIKEIVKKYQ